MYFRHALCALLFSTLTTAVQADDYQQQALEMYRHAISLRTAEGHGKVPELAAYLADQLKAAGFAEQDIHILPVGETAAMVVRYRGNPLSDKPPVSINAHMDVVEADPKDWERDPFTLIEEDGYYFGRGTVDDKLGVVATTMAFIRLKQEGYVPNRDLILAFSGDEESSMASTKALVTEYRDLIDSAFVLNADAGGGTLPEQGGAPAAFDMQAAEKIYVTFELTVTNPGGHSSRPQPDNAIYDLAHALTNLEQYRFPVRQTELTRQYFSAAAQKAEGKLAEAMQAFVADASDADAVEELRQHANYVGLISTTCVPTMLDAGHAENALPQRANATVNCRLFPGDRLADTVSILHDVIGNDAIALNQLGEVTEAPASPLDEEVESALRKAIDAVYPGLPIVPYMSTGATDGMHFRAAGIPSYGVHGEYIKGSDLFSHGLNERLPVKSFEQALTHWYVLMQAISQ